MHRLAVINVVGLTQRHLGIDMPRLQAFAERGQLRPIRPAFPAVTCTAQANYLTGRMPTEHGIVANGWYNRELAEVHFWKQSNRLVLAPKIWDLLRENCPGFTCANLFWWFNMHSSVDYSITPRPIYRADGRKIFDIYTWPYSIRPEIQEELGPFPFPGFWGPAAGVLTRAFSATAVSQWIAEAARWIEQKLEPTLSLVYLPHLDYNLQRLGPNAPTIAEDLRAIDTIAGELVSYLEQRGVRVLVLSEYGIVPVDTPVHLNRLFREQGWLAIKDELGLEVLDCGASRVFAVADHQIAHIYVQDPTLRETVPALVGEVPGVARVLDQSGKTMLGIAHPRAGDFIALAAENAWFTYYYWRDDNKAPDFARSVDIHRKPGFDPAELFLDPQLILPQARIAWRLIQKKLGFRMLMDVIPLDASLVRGSHGGIAPNPADHPIVLTDSLAVLPEFPMESTGIYELISQLVLD